MNKRGIFSPAILFRSDQAGCDNQIRAMNYPIFRVTLFGLFVTLSATAQTASTAQALENDGKWEEAAQEWLAVTRKNPEDARAFASLGVDFSRLQKFQEA